jgi:inward rectifier potassium channel
MAPAHKDRTVTVKPPGADYEIRVVGGRHAPLRDFYHALLRLPWSGTLVAICAAYLFTNAIFAAIFVETGGINHATPGSFRDAFFFSVQTMGTIGYGAMFPESTAANVVVVAESIVSLLLVAVSTGLVFAKFSRSTARFVFARRVTISPLAGAPTLMLRLGNERGNQLVNAQIRMVMVRTEILPEGGTFYRMLDLHPTRERALSLSRSWNVLHTIDAQSPLHGETPESLAEKEVELTVMVMGTDDVSMQTVHASHRYFARDIIFGARLADVLSETPDGHMLLDLNRFHDVEPTAPTVDFPYPR